MRPKWSGCAKSNNIESDIQGVHKAPIIGPIARLYARSLSSGHSFLLDE